MNSIRKIIALLTFVFLFQGILLAQSHKEDTPMDSTYEAPDYCIRVAAGLGPSSISFGGLAYARVDVKNIFFSFRIASATDMISGHNGSASASSDEDYSILFGFSHTEKFFYASLGTGISKVSTSGSIYNIDSEFTALYARYKRVDNSGIGFPLQIDLFWTPTSVFGLGIVGFYNLNKYDPFGGVAFCLQFGKLR